jgi:hypothetical protein
VLLDADGFYQGLVDWLRTLPAAGFARRGALDLLVVAETVPEALSALEARLR